ncbi:MAG: hypothetical protein A2908_00420 [Candidatus Staskawiczbacteria bacterium RIFCSPLOWO2_01_FULL_38_12b]|uniref:Uncharacterized protein n=1 Tax=Candidatus Staskawiczbacteria bacterium RIFCSPLOWO2_01_FULL_38_12b TaxID=1802214 RepID=A0A1G2IFS0_9BACT|nr:MAG: hypothetical protein A2908_00420 [Candidatus Staskawiczbacteria bacterium RIFCSPLOWO2_01_FULL_38_12b]
MGKRTRIPIAHGRVVCYSKAQREKDFSLGLLFYIKSYSFPGADPAGYFSAEKYCAWRCSPKRNHLSVKEPRLANPGLFYGKIEEASP